MYNCRAGSKYKVRVASVTLKLLSLLDVMSFLSVFRVRSQEGSQVPSLRSRPRHILSQLLFLHLSTFGNLFCTRCLILDFFANSGKFLCTSCPFPVFFFSFVDKVVSFQRNTHTVPVVASFFHFMFLPSSSCQDPHPLPSWHDTLGQRPALFHVYILDCLYCCSIT